MKFIINIGTARSEAQVSADQDQAQVITGIVSWREARAALRAVGFRIQAYRFVPPDYMDPSKEGTHIVTLDATPIQAGMVYASIYGVARALHQDCIAVRVEVPSRWPNGGVRVLDSKLIGPAADKWEPFNPAYFLEP